MPNISFKLPKGFFANGTSHDRKGRWTDGSLVRWIGNALRPIGGSRRWVNTSHDNVAYRGIHAWLSLTKTKYIAFGAFNKFKASKGAGDVFYDLTPADLNSGRLDAEYEDGFGYGFYGQGAFGMPIQQNQDGEFDPATTWDIDNFGEILIACHSDDGRILEWDLSTTGGPNLLDASNADFSQLTGLDATSNGGLGGGGWTESPAINGSGWEIDTSNQTCTYTPFNGQTQLRYELRGLTVGQKYRIRGTKAGTGALYITVLNSSFQSVTDLNSTFSIFSRFYTLQDDQNSPYFVAPSSTMYIRFNGDTFGSNTTTISNMSFVSAPVLSPVTNAPTNNTGCLVTDERFVFCLGTGGNPRKIAWSDRENRNLWTPAATNEAGDIELSDVGKIMCGVKTRGQTLILTTTSAHSMKYTGPPYVYSTSIVGTNCGVISSKAAANTEVGVFWMGDKNFYYFDGNVVRDLPCEVLDHVFNDFNFGQKSKVFAWVNSKYNEVWWHYNSSSTYDTNFAFYEPERYVSYNYNENYWMIGKMECRTAGMDRGVFLYPMTMWSLGSISNRTAYVQEQEVGTNFGSFAEATSGYLELGEGDHMMNVTRATTQVENRGDVRVQFLPRNYPDQDFGVHTITTDENNKPVRFKGREVAFKVTGQEPTDWRFGEVRLDVTKGERR